MWKEQVVKTEDRGTLVARGVVGPARWLKTPSSLEHQKNTLKMSPGVFLGTPDDFTTVPPQILQEERAGIKAVYTGDRAKAMMAGGECAQRVEDLPAVQDLVDRTIAEATEIVRDFPHHLAG